jgi:hypothetical protein
MEIEATDIVWPWLIATLVFLVLLGSGRTLRGQLLGRLPFAAGVALSAALGVFFYSMIWLGLGHFGALRSPLPTVVLGVGVLLALPGLFWTWRDFRKPGPGLARGFGPRWFAGGAWFLLIAALVISLFWIAGVHSYGGIGFLFERAGLDHALGRTFFDPGFPRDPFLGDEPLDLWLFGLGAPVASLALAWWLGVAILFGVCGLGGRLYHRGAGLAAAAVLAIVLFASDRPLFLAPALPAALAMMAVMILAVESRGRPHLGRSLVAGGLGGFALISDLGAAAMLLPLLLFGPWWCKTASSLGRDAGGREEAGGESLIAQAGGGAGYEEEPYDAYAWDDKGFEDGVKILGPKKWLTPLRHTAYGLIGLSLPLAPWLLRNIDWVGDPWYGFDDHFYVESDYRFHDADRGEPGFQPSFRLLDDEIVWGKREPRLNPRLQIDPLFIDYELDFGPHFLDDYRFFDGYLGATEWGLGLGLGAAFAPIVGGRRRRRERLAYLTPAFVGYAAGAYLGDFEATTPSALGLLSVSAGQALFDMKDCRPPIRNFAMGGVLVTGGLSLGLSGANDCGYWPTWGDYPSFPQFEFHDTAPEPRGLEQEEEDDSYYTPRLRYTWGHFELEEAPSEQPRLDERDEFELGVGLKYQYPYGRGLDLQLRYEDRDDDEDVPAGVPPAPTPGDAEDPASGQRWTAPTPPSFKPDIRPDLRINPPVYRQLAPKQPTQPNQPSVPSYPGQRPKHP